MVRKILLMKTLKTSYEKAARFVRKLGLVSGKNYYFYIDIINGRVIPSLRSKTKRTKPPFYLPKYPHLFWDNFKELGGWADYLGPSYRGTREYHARSYRDARRFARGLHLHGQHEWEKYCRGQLEETHGLRPADIPTNPDKVYREQFKGFGDWLGTKNVSCREINKTFWKYPKTKGYILSIGINSSIQYRKWVRGEIKGLPPRPPKVPKWPEHTYKNKGWEGWPIF